MSTHSDDAGRAWIKTIDEAKGYNTIDAIAYRRLLSRMHNYAFFRATLRHLAPGQSVLEAGCGWALTSFALAERGIQSTALDISGKLITDLTNLQRELGEPFSVHLQCVVGDIFHLDRLAGLFDAVCSDGTYEHFLEAEDRREILRNFRNSLTEKGKVMIAVPNLHNPFFSSAVDQKMPAMQPFTLMSLQRELEQGGFRVMETGYSFVNPGFEQWVKSRAIILPVRIVNFFFRYLPRPLKKLVAAHLYVIAEKA